MSKRLYVNDKPLLVSSTYVKKDYELQNITHQMNVIELMLGIVTMTR